MIPDPIKPSSIRSNRGYRKENDRMRRNVPPICHICHEVIDLDLPPNHRLGWTADHVTPIALGGDLFGPRLPAHRACNGRRGMQAMPGMTDAPTEDW